MKIENLSPGQVVYDVHSHRMGNTAMRSLGCWNVRIKMIYVERRRVLASWNSNQEQWYGERSWSKWRKSKPEMITSLSGRQRLMTREEKKQAKASK